MASVFQLGGYTSADNEANLTRFAMSKNYSPRGRKLTETRRARVQGELIYSTSDAIISAANSLINACKNTNPEFRYTVNGTEAHSLKMSADCLSGVKVIATSFPHGDAAELATTRTYWVDLEATYDSCDDELVSWQESVEVVGTGGPYFVILDTFFGPRTFFLYPSTAQYYTQRGSAVGYRSNPATPGCSLPEAEFPYRRRITESSGQQMGNGLRFFRTSWTYHMARDPNAFGFPDLHPISK